jgi:hypothetical protein
VKIVEGHTADMDPAAAKFSNWKLVKAKPGLPSKFLHGYEVAKESEAVRAESFGQLSVG